VRSDDFVPGVIGYNAAISTCEKGKQRQRALALLMAVQEHSLPANVITYGASVSAFEKYQQWEEAISLLLVTRSGKTATRSLILLCTVPLAVRERKSLETNTSPPQDYAAQR
jgi:hypothetical protein